MKIDDFSSFDDFVGFRTRIPLELDLEYVTNIFEETLISGWDLWSTLVENCARKHQNRDQNQHFIVITSNRLYQLSHYSEIFWKSVVIDQ